MNAPRKCHCFENGIVEARAYLWVGLEHLLQPLYVTPAKAGVQAPGFPLAREPDESSVPIYRDAVTRMKGQGAEPLPYESEEPIF